MTAVELIPSDALFGVEQSAGGRRWTLAESSERDTAVLVQKFGVPDLVARIMAARGIGPDVAEEFLNPTLRAQMPDPSRFKDMDKAVARIIKAIEGGEKIAIFGDYDVDGATSSALLVRYLRKVGVEPIAYIPDRMKEGYGPNLPALQGLAGEGVTVVITVDCGTTAFEPLKGAKEAGLDIIILDHHTAEPHLPECVAMVNPNRLDEEPGFGNLAACGVTYLFLVALNRALRAAGKFANAPEPDLLSLLDIVALGTVADVVSLTGLNRAFVTQGLKVMAKRENAGMAALADISGLKERPEAWHLGFYLGPRVNAGGRVGKSDLGVKCLTSDEPLVAADLAQKLNHYNSERRAIEQIMCEEALIKAEMQADAPFITVTAEGWHIGVIGIVAGRIKERFNKPCFVIAFENGVGKGSGRSVKGFDIGAATIAARQAGLLVSGGGHPMAAGLTITQDKRAEFEKFMTDRAMGTLGPAHKPEHKVDAVLSLGGATPELIAQLARLAPYGQGNREPRLAFSNLRVAFAKRIGNDGSHLSVTFASRGGARLKAIAFGAANGPMGQLLLNAGETLFHVTGSVKLDEWQGRIEPKLHLDDVALSS